MTASIDVEGGPAIPDQDVLKVRIGFGLGTRTNLHDETYGVVVDALEDHAFDSLWLSEKISGEAPDPLVAMAYGAGRTKKLKFGKYTSWAQDLNEDALYAVLWGVGEWACRSLSLGASLTVTEDGYITGRQDLDDYPMDKRINPLVALDAMDPVMT